jgi:hypothetical protein
MEASRDYQRCGTQSFGKTRQGPSETNSGDGDGDNWNGKVQTVRLIGSHRLAAEGSRRGKGRRASGPNASKRVPIKRGEVRYTKPTWMKDQGPPNHWRIQLQGKDKGEPDR